MTIAATTMDANLDFVIHTCRRTVPQRNFPNLRAAITAINVTPDLVREILRLVRPQAASIRDHFSRHDIHIE